MGTNAILLQYQARLVALHATASQLRLGQMIALAIMAAGIVAILILGFFSIARRTLPLPVALVPLPLALYSGRVYKKRNSALLKTLRLEAFYETGIARLEGRWAGSGRSGHEFVPHDHYYGKDLNVFGDGSLFELLCTCRTEVGRRRLADYLLQSAPLQETVRRQEAVRELQTKTALREQISLLGEYQFQQASWETITEWLKALPLSVDPSLRVVAFVTSTSLAVLALLGWDHAIAWNAVTSWIGGLLLVNGVLGSLYRNRVLASSQAIRSVGMELNVLRQGLKLMQVQEFSSALLVDLVDASRKERSTGAHSQTGEADKGIC